MNEIQKKGVKALLFLMLVIFGYLVIGIVFPVISIIDGLQPGIFAGLFGISIWGGFMWLIPLICPHKNKKQISWDERDKMIYIRSVLAGYCGLWLYVVSICMIFWGYIGPEGKITTNILILIVFGGLIVFAITSTIAGLIIYGKGGSEHE
jgi:hypothetical protein